MSTQECNCNMRCTAPFKKPCKFLGGAPDFVSCLFALAWQCFGLLPKWSSRSVRHAGTHHANRHGVLSEKLLISMISHISLRMASTCYARVVLSCHIRDPRHPAERMYHHAIRNTTAWLSVFCTADQATAEKRRRPSGDTPLRCGM